jgi:hypothetical protein
VAFLVICYPSESIIGYWLRIGGAGELMEWARILAHFTGTVDQLCTPSPVSTTE